MQIIRRRKFPELAVFYYFFFFFAGCAVGEEEPYLDMFDTAAHELVGLVQIPRYVKYLQGEKTTIRKTFCSMRWLLYNVCGLSWPTTAGWHLIFLKIPLH